MSAFPRLLVVTDRTQLRTSLEEVVRDICGQAGCRWVLFRERDLQPDARRQMAGRLRQITQEKGAKLSVSSDAGLAADIGADGVHLQRAEDVGAARERFGQGWIGVSAHSVADVEAARTAGADYVTFSPIFPSQSKPGYGPPLGLEKLREAAAVGLPLFALGGISPNSVMPCLEAGAWGVAIMGAVMRSDEACGCIREYAAAFATSSRLGG